MLKYESHSKVKGHVSVIFVEPYRFWNRSLFLSFAIAAGIHLLALLIFHVEIFKIVGSETIFTPVEAIPQVTDYMGVETSLEKESGKSLWLRKPKSSKPKISIDAVVLNEESVKLYRGVDDSSKLFSTLDLIEDKIYPALSSPTVNRHHHAIHCSESLADRLNSEFQWMRSDFEGSYLFEVLVDNSSGEIIWHIPLFDSADLSLNREFEKILLNLRFSPAKDEPFTKGRLEFVSYDGKKEEL